MTARAQADALLAAITDVQLSGNVHGSTVEDRGRLARAKNLAHQAVALARAADRLADVFGSEELGSTVGTHMTCTEAEAIADVLRAAGDPQGAAAFLLGHGEDDDEGDDHFAPDGRCPACAVDLRQFWHTKWCPRFRG